MRALKLFLFGIVGGLFLLLTSGILYSYYNGDKIAAIGIKYVNEYLDSKLTVEEVHFSLIKQFPFATLDLTNVCALSKKGFKLNVTDSIKSDTLLKTKHLYLKFDLLEIFKNKFKLSRIEISEGFVYLLVNNKDEDNFNIIKTSNENKQSNFEIDLSKLELRTCNVYIINENKKLYLSSYISKISVSGNFNKKSFDFDGDVKSKLINFKIDGVSYCKNIPVKISVKAKSTENNFTITRGELSYADLPLSISGNFVLAKSIQLNINLKAKSLDINNLKTHLSSFLGIPTTISNVEGELSVDAKITGKLDKKSIPSINSHFEWKKGLLELLIKKGKHVFQNINLTANYSNGINKSAQSSSIKLDINNLEIEKSIFKGKVNLNNFVDLKIESTFDSNIQLTDINKFITNKDTIEFKNGTLTAKGGFSGKIDSMQHNFIKSIWLKGEFKNIGCEILNKQYKLEFANGSFNYADKIELSNFSAQLNTMPFQFTGTINGIQNWIMENKASISIEGNTIWDWFDSSVFATEEKNKKQELQFPDNISLALRFAIKKLKSSNFQASDVSGLVQYKPKMFTLNELKFNSMNGSISTNAAIAQELNGDFNVQLQAQLNQLTVSEIFHTFKNFGQSVLLPQHIKGSLTGNINFSGTWDKNLQVNDDKIITDAKFELSKGELIDFKPLEGLSKFIALNELKHIYFSTIKNQIFIKNKVITIPQMDIASSALNLQLSGTHTFKNQYDYHIKLALSEILFRKARTNKEVNENAEEEKNKGAKLYLTIKGEGDNYKVKYDSKLSRKAFVETLTNERKTIGNLLQKEFGSITDTTKNAPINQKKFNIEWEEKKENIEKEPSKTNSSKEAKKPKFKIEWDN